MISEIKKAYGKGKEKALLDRQTENIPNICGTGPNFQRVVNEILAPYRNLKIKSIFIRKPTRLLEGMTFQMAYNNWRKD